MLDHSKVSPAFGALVEFVLDQAQEYPILAVGAVGMTVRAYGWDPLAPEVRAEVEAQREHASTWRQRQVEFISLWEVESSKGAREDFSLLEREIIAGINEVLQHWGQSPVKPSPRVEEILRGDPEMRWPWNTVAALEPLRQARRRDWWLGPDRWVRPEAWPVISE